MPSLCDKAVNYSNPGDCLPRHLPPLQLLHDLDACGPFVVSDNGSKMCDIDKPRVFPLNCRHLG